MKVLIVNKKYNEKKLNNFILGQIPTLPLNTLYKALRKKDIKVNGKRVNQNITIHTGDEVCVYIADELITPSINIDKIYEDSNILVVNKSNNIEVTGSNSLTTLVQKDYENPGFKPMPCHRLDRNTTGLVLFAKSEEALNILFDKFRNHEIEKHYLALVYGVPNLKSARLEAYLFKDSKKSTVYISDTFKKGYKKIVTCYTLIDTFDNNTSLLDVNIETGRTHQIRAHLAYIGHPIIGDGKYGINEVNKALGYKYQQLSSYKLKFNFKTDAGILNYLNDLTITLK
jgi:23S rRNA pseudouridine955/2504/2580 synthase